MAKDISPDEIMQIGLGFWGAKTLLSAVEIGLFTELAEGPLHGDVLRDRMGLHERSSLDFFDSLVSLGLLARDGSAYSNTPETNVFLDRNKPSYVGGLLEMANARLYPFWGNLTEGLKTGRPQNEVKTGGNFFEAIYSDPQKLGQFLRAMTGISLGAAKAISDKFPWDKYESFADVGCAQGGLTVQVALGHAHLAGIGFDLPPCGPHFTEYVDSFDLGDRLKFQGGNFFENPMPKADVIVMGHILHDWDLEEKKMLLKKAYDALPDGGAVVVFEAIIDDERKRNAFGLLMSLNMLIETPGGFDYTGADCRSWMEESGFRDTYVEHLVGPDSMVVGFK